MNSEDITYFKKRAKEERERALAATDDHVRALHREFAAKYDEVVSRLRVESDLRNSRDALSNSLSLLRSTDQQLRRQMLPSREQL